MHLTDSPRILICRLSALGDCVHTLPLLCALRRALPRAHLAWLTQTRSAPLIEGHAALDELITIERGFLLRPKKVRRLRRELQARRYDVAIDPQSLSKSAVPAWLSGAATRIGFARPEAREIAPWLNNVIVRASAAHAVDKTLELLRPLGIDATAPEFGLPVQAAASRRIDAFLDAHFAAAPPVVMHPGAGWDSKLWPPQRYGEVAAHLGRQHGLRTVVAWAGERVKRWAGAAVAHAQGYAVAAPQMNLADLVALIARARMYVGSDSGPLHMAAALDIPTVSMFGPSRPQRNGPYGKGHVVVQAYYQEGTTRQRKRAGNDAMRAISAAMVIEACEEILGRSVPDEPNRAEETRPRAAVCVQTHRGA